MVEIHFLQYPIAYGEWMIMEQKFSIKSDLQTIEFRPYDRPRAQGIQANNNGNIYYRYVNCKLTTRVQSRKKK